MSQTMDRQARTRDSVHEPPRRSRPNAHAGRVASAPTDLGDARADPRLGALSAAVAKLVNDYGRSPTSATSWRLGDSCVVTALEGFATPAERELVEGSDAALVRQLRLAFAEAMAAEFTRVAEAALGRRVVAHRRQVFRAPDICFEIFVLASDRRVRAGACVAPIGSARR